MEVFEWWLHDFDTVAIGRFSDEVLRCCWRMSNGAGSWQFPRCCLFTYCINSHAICLTWNLSPLGPPTGPPPGASHFDTFPPFLPPRWELHVNKMPPDENGNRLSPARKSLGCVKSIIKSKPSSFQLGSSIQSDLISWHPKSNLHGFIFNGIG